MGVDVFAEHTPEMALVQNEEVIETLLTDGSYSVLCDRVYFGRMKRCGHNLNSLGDKDIDKSSGELALVVVNKEARVRTSVGEAPNSLACLLGYPCTIGSGSTPRQMEALRAQFHEAYDVNRLLRDSFDREEVTGQLLPAIMLQTAARPNVTLLESWWEVIPTEDVLYSDR
jgi:hypothetical protein